MEKETTHLTKLTAPISNGLPTPTGSFDSDSGFFIGQNLLSISELGLEGIQYLLELTKTFISPLDVQTADVKTTDAQKVDAQKVGASAEQASFSTALAGKTVGMLFWENSTRTRLSFEIAAKQLSASSMSLDQKGSSAAKGESLRDTAETLVSLGADCLVVRHSSAGVPKQISNWVDVPVINAGDGCNAHPTQALIDCYTIIDHLESIAGLRILIVGDVTYSRVARSCIRAFQLLGAYVSLIAPPTLLPPKVETWGVEIAPDLEAALETADVVYLLRIQKERQKQALVPSLREYQHRYGITQARANLLKDHTLIMHPGPINRGVELDGEVAAMERAVVTQQVKNGVSLRKAVLHCLLGEILLGKAETNPGLKNSNPKNSNPKNLSSKNSILKNSSPQEKMLNG